MKVNCWCKRNLVDTENASYVFRGTPCCKEQCYLLATEGEVPHSKRDQFQLPLQVVRDTARTTA